MNVAAKLTPDRVNVLWSCRPTGYLSTAGGCRGGAGTALVGSPEEVAARMNEYRSIGIDTFILSGYPHLEEAYRFAELVFPLLPLAHAPERAELSVNTGPFGETIANEIRPAARRAS